MELDWRRSPVRIYRYGGVPPTVSVREIGHALMGPHAAALLILGVILTVALLGAVVIASNLPLYGLVQRDYIPTNVDESEFEMRVTAREGANLVSMDQAKFWGGVAALILAPGHVASLARR